MNTVLAPRTSSYFRVTEAHLGSLRSAELDALQQRLTAVLEGAPSRLVIDCREVQDVGAGFAGVLAQCGAVARLLGTEMRLEGLSDLCRRVLSRCGWTDEDVDVDDARRSQGSALSYG